MKVQSFSEVPAYSVAAQLTQKIREEVESKGKDYLLKIDEDKYIEYLVDMFRMEPLIIDLKNPKTGLPVTKKESRNDQFRGTQYIVDVYEFTVTYRYTGSSDVFKIRPDSYSMISAELDVNERNQTVSYSFKIYNKNKEEYDRAVNDYFTRAFTNYQNANQTAILWSNSIHAVASGIVKAARNKYMEEDAFFQSLDLTVDESTESVFTVPAITKKSIPQPEIKPGKEFSTNPIISTDIYKDILTLLFNCGKSWEQKPSIYKGKDEEALRDLFLTLLETRYKGVTAGGETFNRGGKTDILLKYAPDGSNLFAAECKFWHGASEFHKAISQLFDRYLTYRDSKAALMFFVKNKEFTKVNQTILEEAKKHPYFVREVGAMGDTSYSYVFRLPQDSDRHVLLEIMAFHFDK